MKPQNLVHALLSLLVVISLTSCGNQDTDKSEPAAQAKEQSKIENTRITEPESPELPAGVLARNQMRHRFSDPDHDDVFTLSAAGETLETSQMVFTIGTASGYEIHRDAFEGYNLFDYGVSEAEERGQSRDEYLKHRFDTFFQEENFSKPAIETEEMFDSENGADEKDWNEVKSNEDAVGFHYQLGVGGFSSIAYSKQQKKAVVYSDCC